MMLTRFATMGGSVPTLPAFSDVLLLLHMDGTNGSTTFTDSSSFARTLTASGNAQLSTTSPKFGTACGLFDGVADYVTLANVAAMRFASGDFTIEAQINPTSLSTTQCVAGQRDSATTGNGWSLLIGTTGNIYLQCTNGSPNYVMSAAGAITTGVYQHVAACRSGSTIKIYVNGIQVASGSPTIVSETSSPFRLGATSNSGALFEFSGRIDEFRISQSAVYTANFTPPTAAFPNS